MAQYASGETVNHVFKVSINGTGASTVQVTSLGGSLYVNGVLDASTPITINSLGSGIWKAAYVAPSGVAEQSDLSLVLTMDVLGVTRTVGCHDQVVSQVSPSAIRDYFQANTIDVGLTDAAEASLVSEISTATVDPEAIAYAVLAAGISDAITEAGPVDRHSLASLVLLATNADTTSNPGAITVRHPDTDVSLFQFTITTGEGSPVQSIT